jgi:heat shock protein HtpX
MNQLKTVALLGALSGLLIAISYGVGGSGGAMLGLMMSMIMNIGSWFFSDKMALAAYRAQPLSATEAPDLHQMVKRLTTRAGMPMPAIYLIPGSSPNAFATGRDPDHAAVAVTQGILEMLPEDELEAVIAHELSHIRNRDTLTQAVAATIASTISWAAQSLQYAMMWSGGRDNERGPNPIVMMATVLVAPLAATVIQLGISRTREFAADEGAARLTGDARALSRALARLDSGAASMPMQGNPAYQPLLIMNGPARGMLANLFSTHPSTADRIARLEQLQTELKAI